jgi:hypothetical protein
MSIVTDAAVLDLHPDATHPVTLALDVVHGALDRLPGELPALASGDYRLRWSRWSGRSGGWMR